ncbi:MAG: immunoglobulin domain-containing protein, partial [Sedimentisphaerales bacterium]|nr:immunoglobulin domain-containing protein [Sedimentisphaerales bacterium]
DVVASGSTGPQLVADSPYHNCRSLFFEGTSSWLTTSATGVTGSSARTVKAWFKLTAENYRHTLVQYGNNAAGQYFRLLIEDRRLRFEVANGNALALNANEISMNQWHHVALVIDDFNGDGQVRTPEVRFYYDGEYKPLAQSVNQVINTVYTDPANSVNLGGARPVAGVIPPREPLGGMLCDVRIYNTALTENKIYPLANPYSPTNPSPAYNAVDIESPLNLAWQAGKDPNGFTHPELAGYYVYAGTDQGQLQQLNPVILPLSTTTLAYPDVPTDSVCYWQVEEVLKDDAGLVRAAGDPNNITGNVWKFTTVITAPVITTQPQDIQVDLGGEVEFGLTASSVSGLNYQWYYSLDRSTVTPEDDIVLGTSQNYGISEVSGSDLGYYYCVVTNASPISVYSDIAELSLNKLLARYSFENELIDTVAGGVNNGVAVGEPTYVPGVSGYSLSVDGDDSVIIPNLTQKSFTVAFWLNTGDTAPEGSWWAGKGIVDSEWPNPNMRDCGTSLLGNKLAFGVGINEVTITSLTAVNDSQWHYCVVTRDNSTGDMALFVDGLLEAQANGGIGILDAAAETRIGSLQTDIKYVVAQIDELEIYNYPLDSLTVAKNYTAVTGKKVCYVRPEFDLNNDCQVNIGDLAKVAQDWLECGIVPDCIN